MIATCGWVKAERQILDHNLSAKTLGVWLALKAKANFKPSLIRDNGTVSTLPTGGVVFSMRKLSEGLRISRTSLKECLNALTRKKLIRYRCAKEGTIAWIDDYACEAQQKQPLDAALQPRGTKYSPPLRKEKNLFRSWNEKPKIGSSVNNGVMSAEQTMAYLREREVEKQVFLSPEIKARIERIKNGL